MRNAKYPDRLRAVLDTNVIISSLAFPQGSLGGIWKPHQDGKYVLLLSPFIVTEAGRKLREKFFWEEHRIQRTLRAIVRKAEVFQPRTVPQAVPNDPDDNHIIACALEGRADLIVSGDRHLLSLGQYEGTPIIRPADFLRTVTDPQDEKKTR